MNPKPKFGDLVIPHTLSVNSSSSSERWIGAVGSVVKYPTATGGVQVAFGWAEHPDWTRAYFVYWPKDLELVNRGGAQIDALKERLSKANALAKRFTESAKALEAELDRRLREVRTREPGEVWQCKATGELWLVRLSSWTEPSSEGLPMVRVYSPLQPLRASSDSLSAVTDEDFLERYEYVGKIDEMLRDGAGKRW